MQYRHIIKSTAVVGSFVMLSRVFGLIRDMVFASLFGTSLVKSAFDVAFTIPNLFRRLFGEGALSAAFVPIFTDSIEHEGVEKTWVLVSKVVTMLSLFLAVLSAVGIAAVSGYLWIAHPAPKTFLTLDLLRVMFPYALLICLVALCMAILNSLKHFATSAATPVLLNLVHITTMLWICPLLSDIKEKQIYYVAWGVIFAGILQLACQLPAMFRFGYRFRFSMDWSDPRIKKAIKLMLPAMFGMSITQINVVVAPLIAFCAVDWAPAALNYAGNILYLPHGLFATSLGTVLLPAFSQYSANSDFVRMRSTINKALRHLMCIMIPASVGLMVLSVPIVRLIYEHGNFTEQSTILTARALFCYAPQLMAFSLLKVVVPAFYALKDTSTPVRVSVWTVLLSFFLNVIAVILLPLEYKHTGVALGSVIGETINGVLLAWLLTKRIGSPGWGQVMGSIGKMLICAVFMGLAVYFSYAYLDGFLLTCGLHKKIRLGVSVLGSIGLGITVYGLAVLALCRDEADEVLSIFKRKIDSAR